MNPTLIPLASLFAVWSVASAAPREALPFNEVKPAGELRTRIAKNFERLHAGLREGPLLLAARLTEQPADKNAKPAALPLAGELKVGELGKPTLGETPLLPVYHLLDPAYDQIKGSWRQMLFPRN